MAPRTVAITRGAAGSLALSDGAFASHGIAPTTLCDTLGAGDGFIAGFLMAHLGGAALHEALREGAEAASRVCCEDGAFGHGAPLEPGQPGLVRPKPGDPDLKPPPAPTRHENDREDVTTEEKT